MQMVQGFPYFEIQFNKDGQLVNQQPADDLTNFLGRGNTSDLFVISHGWNNDIEDARSLYSRFFATVRSVIASGDLPNLATRSFAIMAIFWPSKKFADPALIPGGAAAIAPVITPEFINGELDYMKAMFDDPKANVALDKAKLQVSKLEDSPKARKQFATLVRSVLPKKPTADVDASIEFIHLPADEIFERLSMPVTFNIAEPQQHGGAAVIGGDVDTPAGGGAATGQSQGGGKEGAPNFFHFVMYF